MLKHERYRLILSTLEEKNSVEVSELAKSLDVTEMTIRRDLKALEDEGLLVRVHGGAKKKDADYITELPYTQKQTINVDKKTHIAKLCAELIEDNDTIFISSGTTNDFIFDYLQAKNLNIITTSLTVFNRAKDFPNTEVILTGGRYRKKSGTFVGYFTNKLLSEIKVKKAFIGTNGVSGRKITTANEEEGHGHQIILDNAVERYILADSTKFGTEAFFTFYDVKNITAIITDENINPHTEDYYKEIVKILK
ncbi:DeoR/GlpR family DNA-binding transcription regulator [Weizmannia sp. FSL W8-0676]|uniref:DeoR/GlpR family DNA-binding transcription regulator n=1 Tax=Weizmannia sp. FSL W8-0676 TaxID=2954703 RepID=UPI003158112E